MYDKYFEIVGINPVLFTLEFHWFIYFHLFNKLFLLYSNLFLDNSYVN